MKILHEIFGIFLMIGISAAIIAGAVILISIIFDFLTYSNIGDTISFILNG